MKEIKDFTRKPKITRENLEKLKRYRILKARENLIDFACYIEERYIPEKVHYLIADWIEQAHRGEKRRLMVFCPPRLGKSLLINIIASIYYMGKNPGKNIILATYGNDLSEQMGDEARAYVASEKFKEVFPETMIDKKSQAKTNWKLINTKNRIHLRGVYINTSVGAGLTGKGGSILTIDDPVKDRQQADSPTYQAMSWGWYHSTFATRGNVDRKQKGMQRITGPKEDPDKLDLEDLDPNNIKENTESEVPIIIVMTRWSHNDLAGQLLAAEEATKKDPETKHLAENWEVLKLPAIFEEDTEYKIKNKSYIKRLGTDKISWKKGESIEPGIYPIKKLQKLRHNDPREFEALYQQNPTAQEGNLFKKDWWRFYKASELPDWAFLKISSYDTSATDEDTSDFSVGFTGHFTGTELFITSRMKERMTFPKLKKAIVEKAKKEKPDIILIEHASSGIDLINDLKQTLLPIVPIKTMGKSKYARAVSATPYIEAGNLKLPHGIKWTEDLINEAAQFPHAAHDDQIDALGQMIRYVQDLVADAYFASDISTDNKFPGFIAPKSWPIYRVIHIPENKFSPATVLWVTIVKSSEKVWGKTFQINQSIVFCELICMNRSEEGEEEILNLSISEICEAIIETENNFEMEITDTYFNSGTKSKEP